MWLAKRKGKAVKSLSSYLCVVIRGMAQGCCVSWLDKFQSVVVFFVLFYLYFFSYWLLRACSFRGEMVCYVVKMIMEFIQQIPAITHSPEFVLRTVPPPTPAAFCNIKSSNKVWACYRKVALQWTAWYCTILVINNIIYLIPRPANTREKS